MANSTLVLLKSLLCISGSDKLHKSLACLLPNFITLQGDATLRYTQSWGRQSVGGSRTHQKKKYTQRLFIKGNEYVGSVYTNMN